jgi:hypothetical protein
MQENKMTPEQAKPVIDKGFANRDADLLNVKDNHEQTRGDSMKKDRIAAMARRMQKAL